MALLLRIFQSLLTLLGVWPKFFWMGYKTLLESNHHFFGDFIICFLPFFHPIPACYSLTLDYSCFRAFATMLSPLLKSSSCLQIVHPFTFVQGFHWISQAALKSHLICQSYSHLYLQILIFLFWFTSFFQNVCHHLHAMYLIIYFVLR